MYDVVFLSFLLFVTTELERVSLGWMDQYEAWKPGCEDNSSTKEDEIHRRAAGQPLD